MRRTDTGLFKGSVLVQFKTVADAEKFLSEPREWNGTSLETRTKESWIQSKKEQDANISIEERKKREAKRQGHKHFSAFKYMEAEKKREDKKSASQGRRGRRENKARKRSRSPAPVEDNAAYRAAGTDKRPHDDSPTDEGQPSKREKLDESQDKRAAEEELNGETKRAKLE